MEKRYEEHLSKCSNLKQRNGDVKTVDYNDNDNNNENNNINLAASSNEDDDGSIHLLKNLSIHDEDNEEDEEGSILLTNLSIHDDDGYGNNDNDNGGSGNDELQLANEINIDNYNERGNNRYSNRDDCGGGGCEDDDDDFIGDLCMNDEEDDGFDLTRHYKS